MCRHIEAGLGRRACRTVAWPCSFACCFAPSYLLGLTMAQPALNRSAALSECAVFPIADLRFALAWSAAAPGLGGWRIEVVQISSGEMVDVIPPGADFPVFCVLPRIGHVELIWEHAADAGGEQAMVAQPSTLRDALLLLCPLGAECLAEIDRNQADTAAFAGDWG